MDGDRNLLLIICIRLAPGGFALLEGEASRSGGDLEGVVGGEEGVEVAVGDGGGDDEIWRSMK
jgi:hypothetical protein